MDDEANSGDNSEEISREFAVLTMKLEDAAGLAADGQGRLPNDTVRECARQIGMLLNEGSTVLARLIALLDRNEG